MKVKRVLSLILVVFMFGAILSSCQKADTTDTPEKDEQVGDSGTESDDVNSESKDEPTKITIGATWELQTAPVLWHETEVFKEIKNIANVEIDYSYYDTDKYNILLAGGDLPDIVFGTDTSKLQDIVESGLALDLKPYLSDYPKIDGDAFKQRNEIISDFYGGEDKSLYFLGNYVGIELRDAGVNSCRGYNVRWDLYKEIGAPEVKNMDDYIETLEAMVEAHPETEDGKKVYACGVDGSAFANWYTNGAFVEPAMANMWTFGDALYMEGFEDGTLYNGYTNKDRSAYWSDMEFYNKLYKKGLFDTDSFTMTNEERATKSANGQYVAEMGWPHNDLYVAELENDPNTLAGIITIPNETSLVFANYRQVAGYFPSNHIFVYSGSKAIDGALSFLNTVHDIDVNRMMNSGLEDVHWSYVDGVPTPTEETIALRTQGGDEWKKTGIASGYNFGMLQSSFIADDGYYVNLFDSDEIRALAMNPLEEDFSEFYDVAYPGLASMKLVEEGKTVSMENCYSELNQSATETMPTDIRRIITQCNDILYEAVPKLVQAENEDEFKAVQDGVLNSLKDAGEETAWKWCLDANTKAQEYTRPIIESLDW